MSFDIKDMKEQLEGHFLVPIEGGKDVEGFYMKRSADSRMMSTLFLFTPEGIVILGDLRPGDNGVISDLGYGLDWFSGKLSERYLCEKFLQQGWHHEVAHERLKEIADDWRAGKFKDYHGSYSCLKDLEEAEDERLSMHEELVIQRRLLKDDIKEGTTKGDRKAQEDEIAAFWKDLHEIRERVVRLREAAVGKVETVMRDVQYGDLSRDQFYDSFHDEIDDDVEHLPGWDYDPTEAHWLCALQQKFSELYHAIKGTVAEV